MKCSLGMLCEPLQSLGLHSHKSAAKKSVAKKTVSKSKKVVKKTAAKKKRK